MPTPTERHPLTPEQGTHLREDLALVEQRLQNIGIVMKACDGDESQATIRAEEVDAALQRPKWELERMKMKMQTAAG